MKKIARTLSFVVGTLTPVFALAVACGSSSSDDSNGANGSPDATMDGTSVTKDGSSRDASAPDGQVDKTPPCDNGISGFANPTSFAKTIGICSNAATDGFGLVSASFSKGFDTLDAAADSGFDAEAYALDGGVTVQAGALPKFGNVILPREGSELGVLSSGIAREFDQVDGGDPDSGTDFALASPIDGVNYPTGHAPPGFPQATPGCEQSTVVNDMIDAKLTLKAPMDAHGFQFDFNFYGSDWPEFVCAKYNDAFVAYVTSSTVHGDNIAFDSRRGPIGVNTSLFDRCTIDAGISCTEALAQPYPDGGYPIAHCEAGVSELLGTGYGNMGPTGCAPPTIATVGGSTGWLTASAPITPGETFTIEFMIWDAFDGVGDSSVLIDNFQWVSGTAPVQTTRAE